MKPQLREPLVCIALITQVVLIERKLWIVRIVNN